MYDVERGGMETLLMGLIGAPIMDFDRHLVDVLRSCAALTWWAS